MSDKARTPEDREDARLCAYLTDVEPEPICGREVKSFTLKHFDELHAIKSPFLVGGEPTSRDVAQFLWVVSPRWSENDVIRRWQFDWLYWRARKLDLAGAVTEIRTYLDISFQDSIVPLDQIASTSSAKAFIVQSIALIAREYGWSEKVICDLPLLLFFQYAAQIRTHHEREGDGWRN